MDGARGSRPVEGGRIEGIFLTGTAAAPLLPVAEVAAVAGGGLDGDRYAAGEGTWSKKAGTGRQLTLVSAEALDDVGLAHGESRRNLVTRGVDLDALVGQFFRVGEVVCRGVRTCPPCAHLEGLTRPGIKAALQDRGGLRADVVMSGTIRVGDPVVALASEFQPLPR